MIFPHVTLIAKAQSNTDFALYGIGRYSCAKWLSNMDFKRDGIIWIAGYWSGLNFLSRNKLVGMHSDWEGIVGDIKKLCLSQPSTLLATAAGTVYGQFQQSGK
jgi:hypothetical protein